ncbi:hypothetical protein, partial [Klebsiella pneumoniae]|uniref:hypothetical protein n=1 Tax=Klebsiella pneumoniae TaxID=573 RepID=UPI004055404E
GVATPKPLYTKSPNYKTKNNVYPETYPPPELPSTSEDKNESSSNHREPLIPTTRSGRAVKFPSRYLETILF